MISDKVEMRKLITLGGGGVLLRGTHHKAAGWVTNEAGDSDKGLGCCF